jgi:hypothetical protein
VLSVILGRRAEHAVSKDAVRLQPS